MQKKYTFEVQILSKNPDPVKNGVALLWHFSM